jgi:hypothetical protein
MGSGEIHELEVKYDGLVFIGEKAKKKRSKD